MGVVDVMGVKLVCTSPEDSVETAVRRMVEEGVGSVAVCDGPRLVGILTERDVLRLASEGVHLGERCMGDAMTSRLVVIGPSDDVVEAARLMCEHNIRHLPVVDGDNVLGVIAMRDVLDALAERLYRTHDEEIRETVHELLARGTKSPAAASPSA
jgi:CBS domain-containing protein